MVDERLNQETFVEVDDNQILSRAKNIVQKAKKEICMTMDLAEELKKPLPKEYFILLEKKMKEGVKITRIAFGSEENFKEFSEKHRITSLNYNCIFAGEGDYLRMLMIDRKYLMFAEEGLGLRKFYFTTKEFYIDKYVEYFKISLSCSGF